MYLAITPSECSTCQQQKTALSAYVHHFLRRLSVHSMASCLLWAPSTLKSSEIESDSNRLSRYELPLLSIVSQQTSLSQELVLLHRISIQQSRHESRSMTKGFSSHVMFMKMWIQAMRSGWLWTWRFIVYTSLQERIYVSKWPGAVSPFRNFLSFRNSTSCGSTHPATDPSMSNKFQTTHPNELGQF